MKFIRIFLLVLIIIGLGLLISQKMWVPSLVNYILEQERSSIDMSLVSVTNKISGISLRVPISASISVNNDGLTNITFGKDYYTSLGFSTTTTKYLTDTIKTSITFGQANKDDNKCSIQQSDIRSGKQSTSTLIYKINNSPFFFVFNSDAGMNQYFEVTRFVEFLPNNTCRFVEFNGHTINPGVYDPEYWDTKNPTYQRITAELKNNNAKFYSVDDMKNYLSVEGR